MLRIKIAIELNTNIEIDNREGNLHSNNIKLFPSQIFHSLCYYVLSSIISLTPFASAWLARKCVLRVEEAPLQLNLSTLDLNELNRGPESTNEPVMSHSVN